ncbi:MAG: MFS transporter [Spirochaetales bacterium]|nr:MFS transporter [Spirochaetales bacterium]
MPGQRSLKSARSFIILMGVVALFGDMTYEGARGLVGPYLLMLGASATAVGFISGAGEFLGYALRAATGAIAARSGKYWPMVFLGYGLNLIAVPGLALVGHWESAIVLILLERIAKAVRSPARSTLVSHAARRLGSGKSFALDEALDQLGAIAGPLLTAAAIWVYRDAGSLPGYRLAFLVLLFPVLANLLVLIFAHRRFPDPADFEPPPAQKFLMDESKPFRKYLIASGFVAFGFADWPLLAYHAMRMEIFDPGILPVLYAGVMGADALAALLFGSLFDRWGIRALILSTAIGAPAAFLIFLWPSTAIFLLAAVLWGSGMGAQESIFKAVIAEMVSPEQRSRAYGIFFAVFGLAWWAGSSLMGFLYSHSLLAVAIVSLSAQLVGCYLFLSFNFIRPTTAWRGQERR